MSSSLAERFTTKADGGVLEANYTPGRGLVAVAPLPESRFVEVPIADELSLSVDGDVLPENNSQRDTGIKQVTARKALRPTDQAPDAYAAKEPDSVFRPLQSLEGQVIELSNDEFVARLRNVTDPTASEEIVALPVDDVPPDDHALLAVGAIFYWHVGYVADRFGQIQRSSMLRFRRLSGWTAKDIDTLDAKTDELRRFFSGAS